MTNLVVTFTTNAVYLFSTLLFFMFTIFVDLELIIYLLKIVEITFKSLSLALLPFLGEHDS